MPDGTVRYLGGAEQVCEPSGRYEGNWLDPAPPPQAAVEGAMEVARAGAARGYRGLLGMDVAILPGGAVRIFDLNFRENSCTAAVLLRESIHRRHGNGVMRLRSFRGDGFRAAASAARRALRAGFLLPLAIFDPAEIALADEPAIIRGLVLGESRADVARRELELAALGLGQT
jgi:hypothetical protein